MIKLIGVLLLILVYYALAMICLRVVALEVDNKTWKKIIIVISYIPILNCIILIAWFLIFLIKIAQNVK